MPSRSSRPGRLRRLLHSVRLRRRRPLFRPSWLLVLLLWQRRLPPCWQLRRRRLSPEPLLLLLPLPLRLGLRRRVPLVDLRLLPLRL